MVLANDIAGLVALMVSVLKSIYITPGLSLWLLVQLLIWAGVVFALVRFLTSSLSGAGE